MRTELTSPYYRLPLGTSEVALKCAVENWTLGEPHNHTSISTMDQPLERGLCLSYLQKISLSISKVKLN